MFEIDFTNHKPELKNNNCYLCTIRKRLISVTPEEETRQSLINYLVKEKNYPMENIHIEVPMTRFEKGVKGRADVIIYDNDDNVLCLIECKQENEMVTDRVISQITNYNKSVNAETLCIVIGNTVLFYAFSSENKMILLTEFPSFHSLLQSNVVECFVNEDINFEKFNFKEPLDPEITQEFYDEGIFGDSTDKKYLPFLFNLHNFYIDKEDRIKKIKNISDEGIKLTKYGNAGGGYFYGNYRAFFDKNSNSTVSFAISSMTMGDDKPVHTSLMFAVDSKGKFHLSLELRVDKYVDITDNIAEITHNGTITVGKMGAAKRSELLDFIFKNQPDLIRDNKIFLGRFDLNKEIKADNTETIEFISNSIKYALIRDEFRLYKKGNFNKI